MNDGFWYNHPLPSDNIQIPNPKSIIGGNYTYMRNLKTRMETESKNADLGTVSRSDIVDSGSLPVLIIQFAISSMNKVVETANKIAEQERKSTIANFIIAFMLFIPMAGERQEHWALPFCALLSMSPANSQTLAWQSTKWWTILTMLCRAFLVYC
jgi:hypothetical protein